MTYVAALDAAYTTFKEKYARLAKRKAQISGKEASEKPFSLNDVDYAIFHSPYGKQAAKGHARMYHNDFVSDPKDTRYANVPNPEAFLEQSHAASLTDKNV